MSSAPDDGAWSSMYRWISENCIVRRTSSSCDARWC